MTHTVKVITVRLRIRIGIKTPAVHTRIKKPEVNIGIKKLEVNIEMKQPRSEHRNEKARS